MLFFKRLILLIVALTVIVFSITISGLNTEKVMLNLYYFKYELSVGFLTILSLLIGLLIGLLTALFCFYMPLKSKIRKISRKNRRDNKQLLEQLRTEKSND